MRLKITYFLVLVSIVCFFSCNDNYSKIPSIEFVSISKTYMPQGGTDSLYLKFNFTDGDGNIGSDNMDNVFVSDSRTGSIIAAYRIPDYLGNTPNNSSRKGEITLVIYSQCCIYANGTSCQSSTTEPEQKMMYEIQIQDKAGNYSNKIQTSDITLECS